MKANLLVVTKLNQIEERAPPCDTRYKIKATYRVVPTQIRKPNSTPSTLAMKKSSRRYPLITITRAATVHTTLSKSGPTLKTLLGFVEPSFV